MGKLKTTIVDDTFSQKESFQYKLFILVGVNSFLYLVTDQNKNVSLLKEYTFGNRASSQLPGERIHELVKQDGLLRLSYSEVKVAFLGSRQTFVPNRLYNPEQNVTYLEHIADLGASNQVEAHELSLLRAHNIFPIDRASHNYLKQMYPRVEFFHNTSALYMGFHEQAAQNGNSLFLNVRENFAQLFFFKSKELLFSNTFQFQSAKDLVYYVLLVYEQFKLDPKEQSIQVASDFEEGGEYHRSLHRYITHIQPVLPPKGFLFGEKIHKQLSNHLFFDVMSVALC